jgi:probable HAF family extracellular repeat protein
MNESKMNHRFFTLFAAMMSFAALAFPVGPAAQEPPAQHKPPRYVVRDLGTFGGTFSNATGINNKGWVTGIASLRHDKAYRAFLRKNGRKIDLGTLGGQNSNVFSKPNQRGEVAGQAETSTLDPLGEDICGFGTHLICLPFHWQNDVMAPLPTLGGNNGRANEVNLNGQVAGWAENATLDSTCSTSEYQGEPVIWDKGVPQQLQTVGGDPDGFVNSINDHGLAVGGSGDCINGPAGALHAVLWQNGSPTDLGNLGGKLFSQGASINEAGQVVGASDLPGDTNLWAGPFINYHAFLWQKGTLKDLGTLPGDSQSYPSNINNKGQIVGQGSRAILWDREGMTDLNTLVPGQPFSSLYLLAANGINERGEIVGEGIDINGELHAFLAIPCDEQHGDVEDCHGDAGGIVTKPIQTPHAVTNSEVAVRGNPLLGHPPSGTVIGRRPEGLAGREFSNMPGTAARRP